MWIRNKNLGTTRLYIPSFMDEPVYFNEKGKAQVSKEVGEKMIEMYGTIEEVKTKKKAKRTYNEKTEGDMK